MLFYLYSSQDDKFASALSLPCAQASSLQSDNIQTIDFVTDGLADLLETQDNLKGLYIFFDIDETLCSVRYSDKYLVPKIYINFDKITQTLHKRGATILVITKGTPRVELIEAIGCHRSNILNKFLPHERKRILFEHPHLFRDFPPQITYDKGVLSIQHPSDTNISYPVSKIDYINSLITQLNTHLPAKEIRFFDNLLWEHEHARTAPSPLIKQFHVTWERKISNDNTFSLDDLSQARQQARTTKQSDE